jgi:ribosomal protein S18 acetylase RimI-like enzyme
MLWISPVTSEDHLRLTHTLFREYADSLGVDLCFQGFEKELAELPGDYAPPKGRLLLAFHGLKEAGCVALRPLDDRIGEMKRLYVRPPLRGLGIGKALAVSAIDEARKIGYDRLRLDTLPAMAEAIALYRFLGFREIAPYRLNPIKGALYLELLLRREEQRHKELDAARPHGSRSRKDSSSKRTGPRRQS